MMNASIAECVEAELCDVLNTAIQFRCHRLNSMINSYAARDLQNIFPQLIDSIFNSRGGHGWGLRSTIQSSNDFELLHEFFAPLGPFLRLCYKLLGDNIKFALPISYLPNVLRTKLMIGDDLPNFYKELMVHDTCGLILHLNAFDYYIFHFALHLCNDLSCSEIEEGQESYSVYRALCCDYLQYFLRSDGKSTILPDLIIQKDRSTKTPVSPIPRSVQTPRLIRISENIPASPPNMSTSTNSNGFIRQHWRTETVLNVFTDIWLCSDLVVERRNTSGLFVSETNNNMLPSTDYIKLIRIVVKQFHAFALSAKYDTNPGFVELKNSTWPIFQDKFYMFLRHMLNRWPLDHNFILVVEMWLSFIQPWRYDRYNNPDEDDNLDIDCRCVSFIRNNLLAYTLTFQQILARVERLDLVVFKNAAMLYRVVKVLSRVPIPLVLYDIEMSLSASPCSTPVASTIVGSPKTNQSLHDTSRSLIECEFKQRIAQLEGPDFKYHCMFDQSVIYQVTKLLKHMQECIAQSKRNVNMLESTLEARKKGFINKIKYYLELAETSELEQTILERKKVPGYLEISSQYMCQIFNLEYEELMQRIRDQLQNAQPFTPNANSSFIAPGYNSSYNSESCQVLNSSQIKEHARNLNYMGDPDLIPPTSHEIKFLVDTLFDLCKSINTCCEREFTKMWYNHAFIGRIARQILMPPMIAKSYVKTRSNYSDLQSTPLPPRLSLRSLAQIKFWIYFSLLLLIGYCMGYPLILTVFLFFVGLCIYVLIRAAFCDSGVLTEEEITLRSTLPKVKVPI